MQHFFQSLVIVAIALAKVANAADIQPGSYEMVGGGWGTLTIETQEVGARTFSIETIGGNAHMCSLRGTLRGTTATVEADSNPEACLLTFTVKKGPAVAVQISTPNSCSWYCGARASFDGLYRLPPKSCQPAEREQRRNRFLVAYRATRYSEAHATLESFYRECRDFLNWIEVDEVRNDLAIAQFHLGKPAQCLATLRVTLGASHRNDEELKEALPPTDYDNYLGVAKATWNNLRLCSAPRRTIRNEP